MITKIISSSEDHIFLKISHGKNGRWNDQTRTYAIIRKVRRK